MSNATDAKIPPHVDDDIYCDEIHRDPYPTYKKLRDLGSAVYMKKWDVYFIGRFEDVRMALENWKIFSSAKGIGLNPFINKAWEGALIHVDPPVHTERRRMFDEVLSPMALKPVADSIAQRADALADRLVKAGEFDGLDDFALDLPVGIVMDLIGWPQDVRPELLRLAEGSWNVAGPENEKMKEGLRALDEMMELVAEIYDNGRVEPGGFAEQLIVAGREGKIDRQTAISLLVGYIVAAFETTIAAMASGLWLYARFPSEWQKLRNNPDLALSAANEIVRIESPLQNFTRWTTRDVTLSDGTLIPANKRVIVSYASANRDERHFSEPDRFLIDRKEKINLGYGHGPHSCAGQGLARMELMAVYGALAKRVEKIELAAEPERVFNNIARAFRHLPIRVTPATNVAAFPSDHGCALKTEPVAKGEDLAKSESICLVSRSGEEEQIKIETGVNLMELIRNSGRDDVDALCGGTCACASCHVYVDAEGLPPMQDVEDGLLSKVRQRTEKSRLACQIPVTEVLKGARVEIAPEEM